LPKLGETGPLKALFRPATNSQKARPPSGIGFAVCYLAIQ